MLEFLSTIVKYEKDPSILSYFRITNGKVEATGDNNYGQLGLSPYNPQYPVYYHVHIPVHVSQIVQHPTYTFAIGKEGELYACGDNSNFQLGIENFCMWTTKFSYISLAEKVAKIILHDQGSFVIGKEGRLYSCGKYFTGTNDIEYAFIHVPLPSLVTEITIQDTYVTAMLGNGEEWRWGKKGPPYHHI